MKTNLRHMVISKQPSNQWSFCYNTLKPSRAFSFM